MSAAYPGLLQAKTLPDGLVLGFVVTRDFQVLRHSATMQRMDVPINLDLERMFPPLSFARPPMAGAECFNATAETPKYCVYWSVAPAEMAGAEVNSTQTSATVEPNSSIEQTAASTLRVLSSAAHVER